jgi:hypothetical protein
MRYWGENIEIDGTFYNTDAGKQLIPNAAEMAQLQATGNFYMYEGNAETYEETVQNMMRDIEANQVGKILMLAINQTSSKLRIIPLTSKEQFQLGRIPCARPIPTADRKGTECVIWFEPWSRMLNQLTGVGNSPYQVLVHELHHALRQMRGKWHSAARLGAFSNPVAFPNAEELFSVTIENIFLSSMGQPHRMLGSYNQGAPLGNRTDINFYNEYRKEFEVWCGDLPDVKGQLERVYGIWNPIRVRNAGK